jgi:hypothetical protein
MTTVCFFMPLTDAYLNAKNVLVCYKKGQWKFLIDIPSMVLVGGRMWYCCEKMRWC